MNIFSPPVIKEFRATVSLGGPIIVSLLAQQTLGFIDTVMAGHLSAKDLAAVAIGRSLFVLIFLVVLGVLLAVCPLVSQFSGDRHIDAIG